MDEPLRQRRRGPLGVLVAEFRRSPVFLLFTLGMLAFLSLVAGLALISEALSAR